MTSKDIASIRVLLTLAAPTFKALRGKEAKRIAAEAIDYLLKQTEAAQPPLQGDRNP